MSENIVPEEPASPATAPGDLTRGPIMRTLILFSLPMLGSNLLQSLGMTINSIWVGQLLGPSALAATANANLIMFVVMSGIIGFASAAAVKIGYHWGARDVDGARLTMATGLGFCASVGFALALGGWLGTEWLLRLLSTPPTVLRDALSYLRVALVGLPFGALWWGMAMAQRAIGDARTPLYVMIVATVLGAALNPLLIMGIGPFPALGIAGSALAGVLGSVFGTVMTVAWNYRRDLPLRLRGGELRYLNPMNGPIGYIVAKGLPIGAQMAVASAAGLIMIGLVNREGMLATAAYGAVLQLWSYIQMPAFALGTAITSMAAQNIGAGNFQRVRQITRAGVLASAGLTLGLTLTLMLTGELAVAMFLGADSPAVPLAKHIITISTWSLVFSGVMMSLHGSMRAHGSVVLPLLAMVIAFYPARLGFYALMRPVLGGETVWWAYTTGGFTALGLTVAMYALSAGSRNRALSPSAA